MHRPLDDKRSLKATGMPGPLAVLVVGYWSGVPRTLIGCLEEVGASVNFWDAMSRDVAVDLYSEEHPMLNPSEHPLVNVTTICDQWRGEEDCADWVGAAIGSMATPPSLVFLCERPAADTDGIGRAVMQSIEAHGGGTVIGIDDQGDQVARWLSYWRRELGLVRTRLLLYRAPPSDDEPSLPPKSRRRDLRLILQEAGYCKLTMTALNAVARERRRSGADALAGKRWRYYDGTGFDRAVVVSAQPYELEWPPVGEGIVPYSLWNLQPTGVPALVYRTDWDSCEVDALIEDPPAAIRISPDYDTFGDGGGYQWVADFDVADGRLWIGDFSHCPDKPTLVRPGRYSVERYDSLPRLRRTGSC